MSRDGRNIREKSQKSGEAGSKRAGGNEEERKKKERSGSLWDVGGRTPHGRREKGKLQKTKREAKESECRGGCRPKRMFLGTPGG